jgi:predicted  nucleic acid-binding Zn-ribbon protein
VISIREQGVYEIDLERLMDHNPIIVQRDGSYLVHLPSVFEKAGKGGEEIA